MWAMVQMCPAMEGGAGNQLTLIETLLIEYVPCVPCADQSVTTRSPVTGTLYWFWFTQVCGNSN